MKWAQDEFTGRRFGKYEVLCRLAVGGMAEIFLAFPRSGDHIGQPVVLKRMLSEQREDEFALQMLLDEAKLTATLNHTNVARVIDLEVDGEEVLLVIDFIAGANMEELVGAYAEKGELLPLGLALTVVREAAQGLDHAHSHLDAKGRSAPIVHRDVTPRNIMLDFGGVTKMLDFGIARATGTQRRTVAGMVRGTTAYMSPEQAVGKDVTPQSDIFSLGIIFHELLTGQRLFSRAHPGEEMAAVYEGEIPPPSRINRRVPKPLDAVVMRALERAKDKRFQTGLDLIRDISLTAGSTAWSRERCAEALKELFSNRKRDIDHLLSFIPTAELGIEPRPSAPASDARTLIASISKHTGLPETPDYDLRDGPKTQMQNSPPSGLEPNLRTTDPGLPLGGKPRKAPAPLALGDAEPVIAPTKPLVRPLEPGASRDFETTEDVPVRGGPNKRRRLDAASASAVKTDPEGLAAAARNAEPATDAGALDAPRLAKVDTESRAIKPRTTSPEASSFSKTALLLAGLLAISVGVVAGVFISRQVSANRAPALGRLTLQSDRPAQVLLGDQIVGQTPLNGLLLPVGKLHLVLEEPSGSRHAIDVMVNPTQETRLDLALDTLSPAR